MTLTVRGSDFVRSSVVHLDGAELPTSYVSASELSASLGSADLATARVAQVTVVNPPPGGGTSNAVALTIGTAPHEYPRPYLNGIVPDPLPLSFDTMTVQLHGTGFVPASTTRFGNQVRPRTFVSEMRIDMHLTAGDLANPGPRTLWVHNPQPGGGSAQRDVVIHAPVPAISSLSATEIPAVLPTFNLGVTGEGFFAASEVLFSGAPRATTFVDEHHLQAVLLEEDLKEIGTFEVTVLNPGPGGGTSGPVTVDVVAPQPRIAVLPSRGAVAGRSGFSLSVHGSGFLEGAVVLWDGEARPTQYEGGTRLTAFIAAEDVAAPTSVSVAVQNPPPSGEISNAHTFTIRSLPPTTVTSFQRVPIQSEDIVYSEVTGRLYVSVVAAETSHGNSLARIDPMTGTIEASVFVGSDPVRLGIADDGRSLYVGLDGASAVRLVDLPSFSPGLQWSLPAGESAGDIEVAPGKPDVVVVSRHRYGFSPSLEGVTVYDAGTPRQVSAPGHTGGSRLAFLESPDTIFGYNNLSTGYNFFTIGIDAAGARHLDNTRGLIEGFYTDIEGAAGRIYGTDGSIIDAEAKRKVGSIGGSIALAVDPEMGRAYLVEDASIGVYDLNTFQRLGTIDAQGWAFEHPASIIRRVVRWGTDGIAFVDPDEVFILRSPILSR
jgi:DNA-binding beta-propeller fold protein YncE